MSKPEHSPLPWKVTSFEYNSNPVSVWRQIVSEDNGYQIAADVEEADSNFIVTACNSYYDNKAAIAELVTWLTNFAHADLDADAADAVTVGQVFQKDALRLIAKHKAK